MQQPTYINRLKKKIINIYLQVYNFRHKKSTKMSLINKTKKISKISQ